MARFSGAIGFGITAEVAPGVWDDVIEEHKFLGDVVLNNRTFVLGKGVNDSPDLNTTISVVGSDYANAHISDMRYLRWNGALWIIESVEIKRPRLILRLGGVYNGPPTTTPGAA